jgi:hypothetical protein
MASQRIHAFAPVDESPRVAFPMLVERTFALIALLNLVLVSIGLAYQTGLPVLSLMLGVAATAAWAACRGSREAVLHDLRQEGRVAAAASHRHAVLGSRA